MDLLKLAEKRSIAGLPLGELKKVLNGYSSVAKVLFSNPQCIILDNEKTIECAGKYYKPKGKEAVRAKGSSIQTCVKTQKKLFGDCKLSSTESIDCIRCHIRCIELYQEGFLERV